MISTFLFAGLALFADVILEPPGAGSLRFTDSNCVSCCGFDYSGYSYAKDRSGQTGLWKLVFRAGPSGAEKILDARDCPNVKVTQTDGTLNFVWKNIDLDAGDAAVDVACRVQWIAAKGRYEFRIAVRNRSERYGLFETTYPRIPSILRRDEGSVILPGGNWGAQRIRYNWPHNSIYPDYDVPIQMVMFEADQGGGFMVAPLDGDACIKYIVTDDKYNCAIRVPAPNAGKPGSANAPGFPIALYPYSESWWQAAKHYRAWAEEKASWMKKGPIARRADFARELREGGLWMLITSKESVAKSERDLNRTLEKVAGRVPVLVHWYVWHKHPFDTMYPDYFPVREGFSETVKRLRGKGVVIMPYVNGRLWDRGDPAFAEVASSACFQTNGIPYVEKWSKREFSAMCQSTAFWRDKMSSVVDRLVGECGANSIYFDQIASMKAVVCYADRHGHPVGGGTHWAGDYCRLVQDCRDRHPEVSFTSENFSEPYIGVFDGFLTWSPNTDYDIPIIPAVYSGYCTTFACRTQPDYTMEAFRAAHGRTFLFGGQGGWEMEWILEDAHAAKFEYMVRLAQIRRTALDFFADGELLGMVPNRKPTSPLKLKWELWGRPLETELPPVMATRWRNPVGREMVAIVNFTDREESFDQGKPYEAIVLAPGEIRLLRP